MVCLRWCSAKEPSCQYRRRGLDPLIRKIPWRRKWQPTPVFLLEESHGQRSLAGYSPWGYKELDSTEWPSAHSTLVQEQNSIYTLFFISLNFTFATRHIHNRALFLLWYCPFWNYFSDLPHRYSFGHLWTRGAYLPVSYLFVFSYCSWGS